MYVLVNQLYMSHDQSGQSPFPRIVLQIILSDIIIGK